MPSTTHPDSGSATAAPPPPARDRRRTGLGRPGSGTTPAPTATAARTATTIVTAVELLRPDVLTGLDPDEQPVIGIQAHAIPNIFDITIRNGTSLCGYPAEYLTTMHDLAWHDVLPDTRCRHCAAELI